MIVHLCDICATKIDGGSDEWHLNLEPSGMQEQAAEILRWEVCRDCADALIATAKATADQRKRNL